MYTLLGTQAIDHLFRVSTGLDSMLIGEAEILGQVKDAYIQAQRARSLGKTLHALFREALKPARKRARNAHRRRIGQRRDGRDRPREAALGSLEGKTVLVVGAGKMGARGETLAARRLRAADRQPLARECARRSSRARRRSAVEMPGLVEALCKRADIVVTSTGASHFV
jgi:glutamyl-tRNA reductase